MGQEILADLGKYLNLGILTFFIKGTLTVLGPLVFNWPWVGSGTMRLGHRMHPGGPKSLACGPWGQNLNVRFGSCL
jgi:hypothetical protein